MQRSDPEDANLRWQAFLIDGFEDWLPAATIAASSYTKSNPRQILSAMISDFYYPDGVEQTTDQISAFVEGFAMRVNAIVRDPKTGEVLGPMRDLQDAKNGKKVKPPIPVIDNVRARKAAQRKSREPKPA